MGAVRITPDKLIRVQLGIREKIIVLLARCWSNIYSQLTLNSLIGSYTRIATFTHRIYTMVIDNGYSANTARLLEVVKLVSDLPNTPLLVFMTRSTKEGSMYK